MYGLQQLTRSAPKIINAANPPCRTIVATKPRVRISFAEKLVHGFIITGVSLIIPVYCVFNINKWRESVK